MGNAYQNRIDRFIRGGIYLVTSEEHSAGHTSLEVMSAALRAGVRIIQLREKNLPTRSLLGLAKQARALTNEFDALLIINDHVDIALAVDADGVHLGGDDLPVADARSIAPDLIIGGSSHTPEEALNLQASGASYVNIGPIFPTTTKNWSDGFLGIGGLREISRNLQIPFTVMGGIKKQHIEILCAEGARIIAVVTAITLEEDPEAAAHELISSFNDAVLHTKLD